MCNLLALSQDDYYILVMNFRAIALGGVLAGSRVFFTWTWHQSLPSFSTVESHYGECLVNITSVQHFPFYSHQ